MTNDYPASIGKYKVLGVIAKGGMGVVYKALHPSLKRYVVIKKMTGRGNAGSAERFKKEAKILLDLQSPYIVHLFDYFTEGGYRYMVEELVDGLALDKLIQKQMVLPCPVAMLIIQDACYALKYAHSKSIVHRDIKPGNILISKRGEIKLADFGIAADKDDEEITKDGVALGTPAYMPPEQFENSATVDNRADIYALGIMLYEMVTGTKPYPGTFSMETLKVIRKGKYIHPRKIDKSVPPEIEHLIHRMIRPNRKHRFGSINSVLRIVKRYLRHYDTHELRVQLAKSVIAGKEYPFPASIQKDRVRTIVRRSVTAVVIAGALFTLFFKAGVIHKTVLRSKYTPVKVEIQAPKPLSNSLDLPMRCFFFYDDSKDIPEVEGSTQVFAPKGTKRLEDYFSFKPKITVERQASKSDTFDIPTIYLKHGNYRVKVVAGSYVWWRSFTVGKEDVTLKCNLLSNATRNLDIKVNVIDRESGKDISKNSEVTILYKDKWVSIKDVSSDDLKTAKVWKIKTTCEGYKEELYSLLIDWYQDVLYISSELEKDPNYKPSETKKTETKKTETKKTDTKKAKKR